MVAAIMEHYVVFPVTEIIVAFLRGEDLGLESGVNGDVYTSSEETAKDCIWSNWF